MTDKPISNRRIVGGDYFYIKQERASNKKLTDFLSLFNFDDYWCYKGTNKFRQVDYQDFINFKHAGYTFFRKDLYIKEHIEKWIEFFIVSRSSGSIEYLDKPTPPFPPEKIIVRK